WSSQTNQPVLLSDAPLGYFTAYDAERSNLARPVELWPRLLHREPYVASLHLFEHAPDHRPHLTSRNVRKLLDGQYLRAGRSLPASLARQMLTLAKHETLDGWLDHLAERGHDPDLGCWLTGILRGTLESTSTKQRRKRSASRPHHPTTPLPKPITFARTA